MNRGGDSNSDQNRRVGKVFLKIFSNEREVGGGLDKKDNLTSRERKDGDPSSGGEAGRSL